MRRVPIVRTHNPINRRKYVSGTGGGDRIERQWGGRRPRGHRPLGGSIHGAKTATQKAKGTPDAVRQIARKHGKSEAQVLLRFAYQSGWPTLPKTTRPERMRSNLDVRGFTLGDAEMKMLEALETDVPLAWGKAGKPMDPLAVVDPVVPMAVE